MTVRDSYPTMTKPAHFDSERLQLEEAKLFPPLVSESDDLVGYLRTGGCTAGCGACCTAFVVPLKEDGLTVEDFTPTTNNRINLPIDPGVRGKAGFEDWEYWLTLHDVYLFQLPSGLLVADIPVEVKHELPPTGDFDMWLAWLEKHGIALIRRVEQSLLAYVSVRCSKLTDDGMCGVFDTPERPKMCAPYPEHPLDIQGIDFCTYKFQPIHRDQMIPLMERPKPQRPKRKKNKRKKKR